jgi:REP element-mobilizing transposase RayT
MPQSLSRVLIHLVFSTKNREPFIAAEHRARTFAYLAGTLNAIDCPAVTDGGVADHVHLLFVLARTLPLSKAVEEVKKESAKWARAAGRPGGVLRGKTGFWITVVNEQFVSARIIDAVEDGLQVRRGFRFPGGERDGDRG